MVMTAAATTAARQGSTRGECERYVVMPDGVEIRAVFKVAADKGVQIRRMNHRRDSLEDIFLNAMEQTGAADGRI